MKTMKGPGIFLAQFLRDQPPWDNLENIGQWVADLGYRGVQIPTWDRRVINLDKAAKSKSYCDDLKGRLKSIGLEITELAAHLQGQVLAVHPAYAVAFQAFHPPGLNDKRRTKWATDQLKKAVTASANLGLDSVPVLAGGLAWHMVYPWPQRPPGLVDLAFEELCRRWRPVLDHARDKGVVISYELHPGSDLFDGATFERFLEGVNGHPAAGLH